MKTLTSKQTFTKVSQHKTKNTKQKARKEEERDQRTYVQEEILGYYRHNEPLFE